MANHPFSEVKGFHWKMRRMMDRLAAYFEEGTRKQYPKTSDAISRLCGAVEAEMKTRRNRVSPTCPNPNKKRKLETATGTSRKYYQRSLRLTSQNDQLRAQLNKHTVAKSGGGRNICPEWIVNMFLSSPGQIRASPVPCLATRL